MTSKEEDTKERGDDEKMTRPKILRSHSNRDDSFGGWLEKPRKGYFWSNWARTCRRDFCFLFRKLRTTK